MGGYISIYKIMSFIYFRETNVIHAANTSTTWTAVSGEQGCVYWMDKVCTSEN